MNKRSSILLATIVFVLLPLSAFAHSPLLYFVASCSIFVVAAGLALVAKLLLVPVFLRHETSPRLRVYVGVTALELFIMWLSLVIAETISPTTHRLPEVDPIYSLYLVLAFFPNLYLLKTGKARVAKAFILELIFPVLAWMFSYFELHKSLYSIIY